MLESCARAGQTSLMRSTDEQAVIHTGDVSNEGVKRLMSGRALARDNLHFLYSEKYVGEVRTHGRPAVRNTTARSGWA